MTREKSQITKVKEFQIDDLERKVLALMIDIKSDKGEKLAFKTRAIYKLLVNTVTYPITVQQITAIIKNLKNKGLVKRKGGSKQTFYYWSITKKGIHKIKKENQKEYYWNILKEKIHEIN